MQGESKECVCPGKNVRLLIFSQVPVLIYF